MAAGRRQLRQRRKRPLLLLVEDDADIARMYQLGLGFEGFDVVVAEDGGSGLELIRERRPDLVLLDLGLPRMDGFEMLEKMQADPELAAKVIVLSNFGEMPTIKASLAGGAEAYVLKVMVTPRELAQIVARNLL